jgi:uncharacterized membrane protein YheB (UPF0754 family)
VSEELVRALVTVLFGALAGGLTNTVAIWMLFHPHVPPRLGRWRMGFLQGAIPKNQPRLAAAIGRTVGTRLLTEEDLRRIFADGEFRDAFDDRLATFLDQLLHVERGSLRELLPGPVLKDLDQILDDVVGNGLERFQEYLHSGRFEDTASRRADDLVKAVADEPIAGLLSPVREVALRSAVEDWLGGAVQSDDFGDAVQDYLDRAARRLLVPDRTFEEVLPLGLVGSFEKAVASYLPLAIERLGGLLDDMKVRSRFETFIRETLHRFLGDLKFHQRVVAKVIMTEDTVDKVLDTIEAEGAERLSEMLRDPTIQSAMAAGVNDAVVDFLRRPVISVLGAPDDEAVEEAKKTLAGWAVNVARDPATRQFLVEKLETALDKAGARTWGEVFDKVPPEKLSGWVTSAARSEPARLVYREAATRLVDAVLDRPIGTPADWFPDGIARRLEGALADPIWGWLQTQVPDVVERIDVARRVEQKVLEFPTQRMEEIIRRVTDRELRTIIRLGYVLGAVIGTILVTVNAFWPGG